MVPLAQPPRNVTRGDIVRWRRVGVYPVARRLGRKPQRDRRLRGRRDRAPADTPRRAPSVPEAPTTRRAAAGRGDLSRGDDRAADRPRGNVCWRGSFGPIVYAAYGRRHATTPGLTEIALRMPVV